MDELARRPIVYLKEISPVAWEHPADRAALSALRQIPGFDELLRQIIGQTTERALRLLTLASAVRVNGNQFPRIYSLYCEAASRLDIGQLPELFIAQSPFLNAGAVGVDKPFIILNSSLLKDLGELEIMAVLGHELGHCASGHALYRTLLWILVSIPFMFINIPLAQIALRLVALALLEWSRKSELSADRAGLLAVQSPEACYTLKMKLSGGSEIGQMNLNEFFRQAQDYEGSPDFLDSLFKLANLSQETHPFPVLRLLELKKWVDAGAYSKILAGEYIRRGDKSEDDLDSAFKQAQKQYSEELKMSSDPLAEAVNKVIENIEQVTKQLNDFLGNLFGSGNKEERS